MLSFSNANATLCHYVKGTAELTKNPDGSFTLRCPGEGICYKEKCEGSSKVVLSNGIEGEIVRVEGERVVSDNESAIQYAIFVPTNLD